MKTWLSRVLFTAVISSIGLSSVAQDSASSATTDETTSESAKSVDSEVVVDIKGGDRIRGQLVGESDDTYVIVSPILGTVSLPRDQVENVTVIKPKKEGDDTEKAEPSKKEADSKSDESLDKVKEATKPKSPWSGSVRFGLTYSDASDVSLNLNLGLTLQKKTDLESFLLTASYFYARNSSGVTDNDVIAVADQTWYFGTKEAPSRWNVFAKGTYQWDEFELWEQRLSAYAGLGYALIRDKDLTVGSRFGAGGTLETGGNRSFDPQFLFEINANWTINEMQSFIGALSFAPEMTNFTNFLLTTSFTYQIKFGTDTPWAFNFSVLDIYDSEPGPDGTTNDLKVVIALGYTF